MSTHVAAGLIGLAATRAEDFAIAERIRNEGGAAGAARLAQVVEPLQLAALHSQLPIEYSMNSSDEFSRKSLIGKTDLNTDWRPASSRSLGRRFICRNRFRRTSSGSRSGSGSGRSSDFRKVDALAVDVLGEGYTFFKTSRKTERSPVRIAGNADCGLTV